MVIEDDNVVEVDRKDTMISSASNNVEEQPIQSMHVDEPDEPSISNDDPSVIRDNSPVVATMISSATNTERIIKCIGYSLPVSADPSVYLPLHQLKGISV